MPASTLKIISIACLVISGLLFFVAYERYQDNANKVQAINQMQQQGPFGQVFGQEQLEPATPTSTKYALLFAILTGVAGTAGLIGVAKKNRDAGR